MTLGPSSKQDLASSQTLSLGMPSLNLNYSLSIIKCKMFLAALLHFRVITDHLLLIPILNSHRLDEIENLGLQRIKTRIMADSKTYADMLPTMKSTNSSEALFSMASQTVTTSYQKGVSDTAWSVPEHLTLDEDLIVYGCRLLIPSKMRQKMLAQLHKSPQGLVHTKQQAQLTTY